MIQIHNYLTKKRAEKRYNVEKKNDKSSSSINGSLMKLNFPIKNRVSTGYCCVVVKVMKKTR
jgi:hypothetical protein